MTDFEAWALNEFADDLVKAIETGDEWIIEGCQQEYDDYFNEIQRRDKARGKA